MIVEFIYLLPLNNQYEHIRKLLFNSHSKASHNFCKKNLINLYKWEGRNIYE